MYFHICPVNKSQIYPACNVRGCDHKNIRVRFELIELRQDSINHSHSVWWFIWALHGVKFLNSNRSFRFLKQKLRFIEYKINIYTCNASLAYCMQHTSQIISGPSRITNLVLYILYGIRYCWIFSHINSFWSTIISFKNRIYPDFDL